MYLSSAELKAHAHVCVFCNATICLKSLRAESFRSTVLLKPTCRLDVHMTRDRLGSDSGIMSNATSGNSTMSSDLSYASPDVIVDLSDGMDINDALQVSSSTLLGNISTARTAQVSATNNETLERCDNNRQTHSVVCEQSGPCDQATSHAHAKANSLVGTKIPAHARVTSTADHRDA